MNKEENKLKKEDSEAFKEVRVSFRVWIVLLSGSEYLGGLIVSQVKLKFLHRSSKPQMSLEDLNYLDLQVR